MNRIGRFFERIGMAPEAAVTMDAGFLGRVQSACVCAIAYENLDILAGKAIDLSPEALYDKIVLRGRGGYCFELNGFLAHMLREMGFEVTERFSRYLRGEPELPMRRHRVMLVKLEDGRYLCDIGVGQIAPRLPLKLEEGLVQVQGDETYCFQKDASLGWVLKDLHNGQWRDYICFGEEEAYDVDFIQPSFFCEKHPDSVFNKEPMIAIKTPEGRRTIDGRVYKVFKGDELVYIEENISDERMSALLSGEFMLKAE